MTKLEILQADYNTLSRTVVRVKRKGVLGKTYLCLKENASAFFYARIFPICVRNVVLLSGK